MDGKQQTHNRAASWENTAHKALQRVGEMGFPALAGTPPRLGVPGPSSASIPQTTLASRSPELSSNSPTHLMEWVLSSAPFHT